MSHTWKAGVPACDSYHGDVATNYLAERVNHPIWLKEHEAVRTFLLAVGDGARLLDVPFGTGRFISLYQKRDMFVTGVDISPEMLNFAQNMIKKKREKLHLIQGDASNLPFPDGRFDIVVCVRFLESIIPFRFVTNVLSEMRRVSRAYAIVRLNCRESHLPELQPPGPEELMGTILNLRQLSEFCRGCGWILRDTILVGRIHPDKARGERRICLLEAICSA